MKNIIDNIIGFIMGFIIVILIIVLPISFLVKSGYDMAYDDIQKELLQKGCGEFNKTTGKFYIKDFSKIKSK